MLLTSKLHAQGLVEAALHVANRTYNNNLVVIPTWAKGNRFRFVLRTLDSRAYGSRLSWSGRHIRAASWEAHRDFMTEIFKRDPDARLQTGMATYRGIADFEAKYPKTGQKNIGSQMRPVTMPELSI